MQQVERGDAIQLECLVLWRQATGLGWSREYTNLFLEIPNAALALFGREWSWLSRHSDRSVCMPSLEEEKRGIGVERPSFLSERDRRQCHRTAGRTRDDRECDTDAFTRRGCRRGFRLGQGWYIVPIHVSLRSRGKRQQKLACSP